MTESFMQCVWVRRPVGEALNPEYCVPKRAYAVNVNVWGCMAASGQGYIHIFLDNLNGNGLANILKANLSAAAVAARGETALLRAR